MPYKALAKKIKMKKLANSLSNKEFGFYEKIMWFNINKWDLINHHSIFVWKYKTKIIMAYPYGSPLYEYYINIGGFFRNL